uniref:Secreted protein n=1 Tax=Angiostrongylus cantonensis TaxID=6313 RepID=A0A0K0CZZ6_ANGCA
MTRPMIRPAVWFADYGFQDRLCLFYTILLHSSVLPTQPVSAGKIDDRHRYDVAERSTLRSVAQHVSVTAIATSRLRLQLSQNTSSDTIHPLLTAYFFKSTSIRTLAASYCQRGGATATRGGRVSRSLIDNDLSGDSDRPTDRPAQMYRWRWWLFAIVAIAACRLQSGTE